MKKKTRKSKPKKKGLTLFNMKLRGKDTALLRKKAKLFHKSNKSETMRCALEAYNPKQKRAH